MLGRLIAAAEPTLPHLVGKNVVVMLGRTGAGKSTFVHTVAGRPLHRRQYRSAEDGTERDVFEAEAPLEGFVIGHEQASQTKCIRHFVRDGGAPAYAEGDPAVVYLDSPGYARGPSQRRCMSHTSSVVLLLC